MNQYELSVSGMGCAGCEETVEEAASDVEGVQDVDADHETGIVTVTAEASAEAVRDAITQSGYDVQS